MTGAVVIHCATAGREQALRIADALVARRLAACVQLLPIDSVYRWQGEVRCDAEVLLLAKTLATRFDAVAACMRELHDYDTPEIMAMPVVAIDPADLAWLEVETRGTDDLTD